MNKGTGAIVALAVVVVAGGFYIVKLNGDLSAAQSAAASATKTSQQCTANLDAAQKNVASITTARDGLQTQLSEVTAKAETIPDLTSQLEAANKELASLKANAARTGKLTGYWRELFDYNKPKPPAPF